MKKAFICLLLIACIFLVSCDQFPIGFFNMTVPTDIDGSTWLCTEPLFWFEVDIIHEAEPSNSKVFTPPVVVNGEFYHNKEVYKITRINSDFGGEMSVFGVINGEEIFLFDLTGTSFTEKCFKCKFKASQSDLLNLDGLYDDIELIRILDYNDNNDQLFLIIEV